ncbi:AmpG family muropeptide MFS transporter [Bacteriovorax sp. DB6_IX]|uniref:AmpG family muropeptide MFS transporter n=1 Tax=Bacteriovorax sp. DB6_IX TaxID=1353530 RepID=UPI00038A1D78|nr:AmpG family muropeptide MFS transporter [Bacteriovorax sp. DB6_IX]EQC49660.1 transporter, major facilitator family protein [Bacteriovorax sp. DB6_IX]
MSKKDLLREIFSKKMSICFLLGFSSGLPLLVTITLIQAWLKEENIDLTNIGLITLVQLPYTWKFVWSPIFDRFKLPILGRRRGWMLASQVILILCITALGFTNPVVDIWPTIFISVLIAFFSASQDIVVDAHRREYLEDEELGLGSTMYIYGYRIAMLVSGGGALMMSDHMSWRMVFFIISLFMIPGILTTLWAPEPEVQGEPPKTLKDSIVDPFVEFLKRDSAILILGFVLLYKVGDTMASALTTAFYLDLGFTKTHIGAITKVWGLAATLLGAFVGGSVIYKMGIRKSLWIFGILQAVSTAGFALLANIGFSIPLLTGVIAFENISGGMGTAAYAAYMASQTNKKFTATQYALLSALMSVPRSLLSAPTGYMAKHMGWTSFFVFCTLIAIPGLLLLLKIAPMDDQQKIEAA